MDGEFQNHWLSLGFIKVLLRHMDGEFQSHWFSSGFIEILREPRERTPKAATLGYEIPALLYSLKAY